MWKPFVITLLFLAALLSVEGRGGGRGGGGSRGGSRSSSRSSSSRSSSGVRAAVSRYRGPVYQRSSWTTMAAAGTLYGIASYKTRHLYLSHPHREPAVCFNAMHLRGGTYGYFICPEPGVPDKYKFCCGANGNQRCCTYNEYNKGRLIGIIVGSVFGGLILIGIVIFVCCWWRGCRGRKPEPVVSGKRKKSAKKSTPPRVEFNSASQDVTSMTSPTPAPPEYSTNAAYSSPADYGFSSPTDSNIDPNFKNAQANGNPPAYYPTDTFDSEPRRRSPTNEPPQYGFKDAALPPSHPTYNTPV